MGNPNEFTINRLLKNVKDVEKLKKQIRVKHTSTPAQNGDWEDVLWLHILWLKKLNRKVINQGNSERKNRDDE